ncbi:MAG: flagellar basal-body rod protein FlgF [Lautropia sp.]
MDRMIYLSMTGAKSLLERQDALSHNLANAGTDGFRADLMTARAVPLRQDGTATTRVYNIETTTGFNAAPGPVRSTGNPLDLSVHGNGWLAVQGEDGTEAYTRDGALTIDDQGLLRTQRGQMVLGDGGPITVPANAEVTIGADGTISAKVGDQPGSSIGRLKLVAPAPAELIKGADGLVRMKDGDAAPADDDVRVAAGTLEGSNVNVVEAMVGMIQVARQFEMQMKLLQNTETNEQRAAQLLSLKS